MMAKQNKKGNPMDCLFLSFNIKLLTDIQFFDDATVTLNVVSF